MQYQLDVENVSSIRRRLHFTLSGKQVSAELDLAFNDLKNKVRLPGFRPGKVPRKLLESRFGKQIRGEVSGRLVDRAWRLESPKLEVAGQPSLEDSSDLGAGDFTFVIGVDVRPEIEVKNYTGIQVAFRSATLADDAVDARVNARLASQSRIQEVTDRPVQAGDEVLTKVTLTRPLAADAEAGATAEILAEEFGTKIFTAGDRFYPGLETLLIGLSAGESGTGSVTIGAKSVYEHLQGQTVDAAVEVMGIQARTVPTLTDEAATDLGYEGGAEGMRAAIRMELQAQLEENARQSSRVELLEKLVAANDFDVPESLINEQFEALQEEMKVRRAYQGQDPRSIRFSDAELADLHNRGRFAAKAALLLAAISRQESLAVTDADMDAKIEEIASSRQQAPAAIRGYLEREGAMGVLKTRIAEEKTLEWLLEHADLKVVEPGAEVEEKPAAKAPKAAKAAPAAEPAAEPAAAEPAAAEPAAWNAKMKKDELLAIAQELGLDVNSKNTKADILEALTAHGG